MCGLPIAAGGAQLLSGGIGMIAGSRSNKYQRKIARRNQQIARDSAYNKFGAIQNSVQEAELQAAESIRRTTEDALRATGRVKTAAGEAGIKGNAVEALMQDFARQEGQAVAAARLNQDFARRQGEHELRATALGLESQLIASTEPEQTSLFSQALGTLGSAFGATMRADNLVREAGGETLFLPE